MSSETTSPETAAPEVGSPETRSLAPIIGATALALGYAGAGAWQRSQTGLQVELLVQASLCLPLILAPFLPRYRPPGSLAYALAVVALLGVRAQGGSSWSLDLCVLASLPLLSEAREVSPLPASRTLGGLALGLATLGLGVALARGQELAGLRLLLFLPVLALGGRALLRRPQGLHLAAAALYVALPTALALIRAEPNLASWIASLAALGAAGASWVRAKVTEGSLDPHRARRWGMRLGFPLVLLVALFGLLELAFQLIPNRQQRIVVPQRPLDWHVPGGRYRYLGALYSEREGFQVDVTWNREGFNDVDHELEKPPGTRRVLVLGDSYVEAIMIPREHQFTNVLGRELSALSGEPVEVLNYGWSGWGQRQELAALTEGGELHNGATYPPGFAYDPDLVVVEFLPSNDVRNNLPALEDAVSNDTATPWRVYWARALERGLYFSATLLERLDGITRAMHQAPPNIEAEVYRPRPQLEPELWAEAWAETERLFAELQAACRKRSVPLLIVVFSATAEVRAQAAPPDPALNHDHGYPARRVEEICKRLGIPCLQTTEALLPLCRANDSPRALAFKHDGHWNEKAHQAAGAYAAKWLHETGTWRRALSLAKRREENP